MRAFTNFRTSLATACVVFAALAMGCGGPEYPNCDNDDHCHEGEFCVNGTCQQCRDDSDCAAGQQCNGGRCDAIPGWCASNANCPDGQECVENRCQAVVVTSVPTPEPQAPQCQMSPVYFAYDSSDLDATARSAVEQNAACANERDLASLTVVGHCDPRGTEEYNLALGERRAQTTAGHLNRHGVSSSRTRTRSMGEEMARGHNESTWRQDRRAAFDY